MTPKHQELFRIYGSLADVSMRSDDEEEVVQAICAALKPCVPYLRTPLTRTDTFETRSPDQITTARRTLAALARPTWHRYFMSMAELASTRATCDRKHVGAVLVIDRRVVATGYNGSPPGLPHCDDEGHDIVRQADGRENCVRTIHAEMNALLQAAAYGVSLRGATLYTNTYPCWNCAKALLGAGVVRVITDQDYNNDARVDAALRSSGVTIETLDAADAKEVKHAAERAAHLATYTRESSAAVDRAEALISSGPRDD